MTKDKIVRPNAKPQRRLRIKPMSERHNRAALAYRLKSVAERNAPLFVALDDGEFLEREPLYLAAVGDDAVYQLLLADMLFERSAATARWAERHGETDKADDLT